MCMQDVAIQLKMVSQFIVRNDVFTAPLTINGDPSLMSITIRMDQAAAICSIDFKALQGLGPRPTSSSINPDYPIHLTREEFGWAFDGQFVISTSAATPVGIILQFLDRSVYQTAFNMEL